MIIIQTTVKTKRPYFLCRATNFDSKPHFPLPFPSPTLWVFLLSPQRSVLSQRPTLPARRTHLRKEHTFTQPLKTIQETATNPHRAGPRREAGPSAPLMQGLFFVDHNIILICDHVTLKYSHGSGGLDRG